MSYLVLARKWRPQGFEDLIGQSPIVKILTNSIAQGKLAHAYVFSGPRGVGKTSTARILAKALNCAEGPTPSPCGRCAFCTSIADGSSIDVMEIDGASNNSVDHIRDLRERVKYAPSGGRYKVYIIDEAHMLSGAAFNALLKTLEEPPPHVVFVLATTEPRKIPLTVMSRCQHLPFRRVSTQGIKERLKLIAEREGIAITDAALGLVARAGDGSIRDSLTALDQLASFSESIDEADVKGILDTADFAALSGIADAVIVGSREEILSSIYGLVETGVDMRVLAKDLIKFFRDLLVAKVSSAPGNVLDLGEEELRAVRDLAARVSEEHLTLILSELIKMEADVRNSFSPRVALEMSLMKISFLSTFRTVNEAIASLAGAEPYAVASLPAPPARAAENPPGRPDGEDPDPPELESASADASAAPGLSAANPPFTGDTLLTAIIERLEDPRVSSRLSAARAEISGDALILNFNSSDAEICARPFKDDPSEVERLASELRGAPTRIEIHIRQSAAPGRNELREKALSERVVQEALDLFEGRIVKIRPVEKNEPNGG